MPEEPVSTHFVTELRESTKLSFDYFKHLTTLSTGAIALLGTLRPILSTAPHWRDLLYVSIGGFFLCVLASVFAMLSLCHLATPAAPGQQHSRTDGLADTMLAAGSGVAAVTFVLAVCSLAVFFIRNT